VLLQVPVSSLSRHVIGRGFIAPSDKLRIAGIGAVGKGKVIWQNLQKPQRKYCSPV
jgi:hypothetical protein